MRSLKHFSIAVAVLFISSASSFLKAQCSNTKPPTFTVHLPLVTIPPDEEGEGWDRPDIWNGEPAFSDDIVVPNGRPIYALIVSGYSSNAYLDQMMLYNFARYLMSKGAYVHYSWWNNLLAPYMERPLHSLHSYPGSIFFGSGVLNFGTLDAANHKALPAEDYQFLSDAKLFLTAIRQNNPNAIIIVAGHSMGGGAVVHLATQTNELIDILAPIDPVGNRNYPWSGIDRILVRDFNWTRWRVSRDNFRGYRNMFNTGTVLNPNCQPGGPWLSSVPLFGGDPVCALVVDVDDASTVRFGSNIINLHHRFQKEAVFPYDYDNEYHFVHTPRRPNAISTQMPITIQSDGSDPSGWPDIPTDFSCCPQGNGIGWPDDGHEEIIGNRGPTNYDLGKAPIPLATRLRTSPQCVSNCTVLTWPARSFNGSSWGNGNSVLRVQKLKELETFTANQSWSDAPIRPQLCKVSQGLIDLFNAMNKPPTANAGNNLLAECNSNNNATVTLDGSASTDPDNDELGYTWSGSFGTKTGKITSVILPVGTHCITLTVEDPSGHIDKNKILVTVQDNVGPVVNVTLTPSLLWPPNHKFVEINAAVTAVDACGTVESIVLHSIDASEGANIIGSGNTSPDIIEANYNTHDLVFKLRAERSGPNRRRIYTVTYKATDNAGNSTFQSAEVVVENPSQ